MFKKSVMSGIWMFVLSLVIFSIFGVSNASAIVQKKPAVLFVGSTPNFKVAKKLSNEGYTVNIGDQFPWTEPLTWDIIKHYNVIVLDGTGLGMSNANFTLTKTSKQDISVLIKFLSAGGGILFMPYVSEETVQMPAQKTFGKIVGIDPLFREVVVDKRVKIATPWRIPFAWTDNIIDSPITKNAHLLWYPSLSEGDILTTVPFIADSNWDVVVKGSKTSHTEKISFASSGLLTGKKGSYSTEVPLMAYRKFGKGRLVCFSITPAFIFRSPENIALDGIVFNKGLEGKPSSGSTLFRNALNWLSKPSIKGNVLGGAGMDVSLLKNPYKVQFSPSYNWNTPQNFPAFSHWYKGIIGAQAKYNYFTEKWNVGDWVRNAKQDGLSYIVFLQPFSNLTKGEFQKLKKECKKYTTPNFTAIPGFTINDELGDRYFFCGGHTLWPAKKYLSSDGKEFISYDPTLGAGVNPYQKGQLAMTLLNYTYTDGGFGFTSGDYLFSKGIAPFTDFFSDWDAMGVITSKNNKIIENRTKGYLKLCASGQGPSPVAIDLLNNPEMLSKAKWFTMLGGNNIDAVNHFWDTWHFFPSDPTKIYITEGPKIKDWAYVGSRDYPWTVNGNYVWKDYRWKLYGDVTSRVGLKEIVIYDGTKLFRRFLVGGKKQFQFTLDINHDKQHVLVLEAVDVNGKKAISRDRWDRNERNEEFMCADRNNQLNFGKLIRKDGTYIGSGEGPATPYKRIDPKEIEPAGGFFGDPRLGAPAFDGAPGGYPQFFSPVDCNLERGQIPSPSVSDSIRLFDDGDVNIGEGIWKWNFTDNINVYNVWHTLWKTQPAKEFTVTKTNYLFNIDPNSPIAVYLWNIHIKLLKNLPNNGFNIGFLSPVESKTWAIKSGNALYSGQYNNKGKQKNITTSFNKGDYAAMLNSPIGGMAIYPLTNGLQVSTTVPGKNYIYINLPKQDSPQKKGQTKTLNLLFIGIPRNTPLTRSFYPSPLNKVVKTFEQQFGLTSTGKTGYTLNIKHGKILSHRYILNIKSGKDKCFSGEITGNLISTLPLVVSNLNNRDSVYLYDRGLKEARPIGVFNHKAYSVITLHGTRNLFIGEPVICDNPDLFVQVTQTGKDSWHLGINNPTNRVINAHIILNPYFDPFKGKIMKESITINPGKSISRTIYF